MEYSKMSHATWGCLSHLAFKIEDSKLTRNPLIDIWKSLCNPYLYAFSRIVQTEGFKRLAGKIQVFNMLEYPSASTRLSHSFRVSGLMVKACEHMGLNVPLGQVGGLVHDIAHTPLGHAGERLIKDLFGRDYQHNVAGVSYCQDIEDLDLPYELLQMIWRHGFKSEHLPDETQECLLLKIMDPLDYIGHDISEALRLKQVNEYDFKFPELIKRYIDCSVFDIRRWEQSILYALFEESASEGCVSFSKSDKAKAFWQARAELYEGFYEDIRWDEERIKCQRVLEYFRDEFGFRFPEAQFADMTMEEVYRLDKLIRTKGRLESSDLTAFGFYNRLRLGLDLGEMDLSWAELSMEERIASWGK